MINLPRVYTQVQSVYIEAQSLPDNKRYVFTHTVAIRSLGRAPVQLLGRYQLITNGNGREIEVQGEGVVGAQPLIVSGEKYRYTSDAIIETPLGTMQGHYEMTDGNGVPLSIDIPVFRLAAPVLIHQENMAIYPTGDVYGCYDELIVSLYKVEFIPGKGTLWLTGDLAARGPDSLNVLCYMESLGDNIRLVLGDHDSHLLAVFAGTSRNKPKDRLTPLLGTPGADKLLSWLRRQPLLQIDEEKKLVTVHAGVTPQQDLQTAEECACDIETVLSSDSYPFFFDTMYDDMPGNWSPELRGLGRPRFIINAFIRMRFCFLNGQLDMYSKESPEETPALLKLWFAIPGPVAEEYSIVFSYWASLKGKGTPGGVYALDVGYC